MKLFRPLFRKSDARKKEAPKPPDRPEARAVPSHPEDPPLPAPDAGDFSEGIGEEWLNHLYGLIPVRKLATGDILIMEGELEEEVMSHAPDEPLSSLMETLSAFRPGAVLITDGSGVHRGVVSKADLASAYRHGIPVGTRAAMIMSPRVFTCRESETLASAVHQMVFAQVRRLFIYGETPEDMVGVLTLADAVRLLSGACGGCVSGTGHIRQCG